MSENTVIYGERIADLLPALLKFREAMTIEPNGMHRVSVTLEPDEGTPLCRALMRVEAELLREDADALGSPRDHLRTHQQRTADALVRLVQALPPRPGGNASTLSSPRSDG